ncbi:hypothetical protein HDA40_005251 [Hamadaea flava]|uniref:MarR family transcriptional regulator n=1 Tax=Hamadaea flava TaxID=1742688 RepID=A0ABV8LZT5_9ACTN|nr:helix-turn-helix domain-containing protein [Hamadaea flava]MCP2326744.1 hypothetical protein [Hamadaea flava]
MSEEGDLLEGSIWRRPIVLDGGGPLTIQELADRVKVAHSAMSQTVTAMRLHDHLRLER